MVLTRAVAGFGGLLMLEYQKSSAAKASHGAGRWWRKSLSLRATTRNP
ncbi:MAG: hypothetical protein PHH58_14480 [Rhodoferax sp.]|nr:hypothetical protein [Rhodoferax sp.]